MRADLTDLLRGTPRGEEADALLGKCVHCGFCNATCPTYQLEGDELDGPRGRIYLIKRALEGHEVGASTQLHLDRCLACSGCETTCPSGVEYGRLLEIGRGVVAERVPRSIAQRLVRWAIPQVFTRRWLFGAALWLARLLAPLLPRALRSKLPRRRPAGRLPSATRARKMLLLEGCVQPAMFPSIDAAAARVLDRLGVELVRAKGAGCCGAIRHHIGDAEGGLVDMRRNIDAWWPHLEAGVETIVITAAGCSAVVRDYGHLLRHDPAYADKARRISERTRDISEFASDLTRDLAALAGPPPESAARPRVAYHPPCTLQHTQKVRGHVEALLAGLGAEVKLPAESHLCCGSAGTYSMLQPELALPLRDRKLESLLATEPSVILSANVGCIAHLQSGTHAPVLHWIEWVDQRIAGSK
jgi:glycolate oxidase iron-sulfur subunit